MNKKLKVQHEKKSVLIIALIFLLFFSFVLGITPSFVYAAESESINKGYTTIIEDLSKDENFSILDYPINNTDYSLEVIQIAESSNDDLFIYVYQPCVKKDFKASTISISQAINDNLHYELYTLTYLNSTSCLYKYKVNDFTLKQDALRYYDISEVFRPFDSDIDDEAENGNTISEVSFEVAQLWTASTVDNKITYTCVETDVIKITDKFVGFVRYKDGFNLWPTSCDAHFVAFDTDKPIDKLLEVDLSYTSQKYQYTYYRPNLGNRTYNFENIIEVPKTITYEQEGSFEGNGLFAGTYNWPRISTVEEFKNSVNYTETYNCGIVNVGIDSTLTESGAAALEQKQWVLRFAETDFHTTYYSSSGRHVDNGTIVADVTILRLKFEIDGETYNLGVVDNKQSGSDKPVNDFTVTISGWFKKIFNLIPKWLKIGLYVLAALFTVLILYKIFSSFYKTVSKK